MIRTYLSNNFVRFFWLTFILTMILQFWWCYLILLFVGYGVFWIFRKYPNKKTSNYSENIFLAPSHGRVINIFFPKDVSKVCIQMVLSLKKEYGLYLPMQGEIMSIEHHKSQRRWRFRKNLKNVLKKGTVFSIKSRNNIIWELQLIPCWFGLRPKIYVLDGDSGKSGANFGFFPFGGSVLIYLPKECVIRVKTGDFVLAHETVLATIL